MKITRGCRWLKLRTLSGWLGAMSVRKIPTKISSLFKARSLPYSNDDNNISNPVLKFVHTADVFRLSSE